MRRLVPILALVATACTTASNMPTITDAQAGAEAEAQRELAVAESVRLDQRATDVGFRVKAASAELCGEHTRGGAGLGFTRSDMVSDDMKVAYNVLFHVDGRTTVVGVTKGSPAEAAGIQVGDKVLKIEGKPADPKTIVAVLAITAPAHLDLLRNDVPMTVTVQPIKVCDYPIIVQTNDAVNAFADGKTINITSGMMRFVESDDELALIIGHEMGHNVMEHMDKKRGNAVIGAVLDGVIAGLTKAPAPGNTFSTAMGGAFSQDFESEADYVGTYYAARAGYDISQAKALWRRMAATHPAGIHLEGGTHPSTAKRVLAIADTQQEIERKKAAGQPLVPEKKSAD